MQARVYAVVIFLAVAPSHLLAEEALITYQDAQRFALHLISKEIVSTSAFDIDIGESHVAVAPVIIDLTFRTFDERLLFEDVEHSDAAVTIAECYGFSEDKAIKKTIELELARQFANQADHRRIFWKLPLANAGREITQYLTWLAEEPHTADQLRKASVKFDENFAHALYGPVREWAKANGKEVTEACPAPAQYLVKFVSESATSVLVTDGGEKLLYDFMLKANPQRAKPPNYTLRPFDTEIGIGRICHVKAIFDDGTEVVAPHNLEFQFDGVNVIHCTRTGFRFSIER